MKKTNKLFKFALIAIFLSIFIILTPSLAQEDFGNETELYRSFYTNGETETSETSDSLILDIYVDETGKVLMTGYVEPECLENFSFLESSEYLFDDETNEFYAVSNSLTSKQADDWEISLSTIGYFSECHIMIYFPEIAKIKNVSYPEGFGHFVYSSNESMIVDIQGFDVEDPDIICEYQQGLQSNNDYDDGEITQVSFLNKNARLITYLIIILVLIIGLLGFVSFKNRINRKEKEQDDKNKSNEKKESIEVTSEMNKVIETLSERERAIVEALIKNNGVLSQADIRYETEIPKSSLSGIVYSLEKRKIIKKKKHGRTNIIELSEWFRSNK